MYHKLIVVGYLGTDPEQFSLPQGDMGTSFRLAANRRWTGQDGQIDEETIWFRVVVYGAQARACQDHLAKGRLVLVEGRLVPDRKTGGPRLWTNQEGRTFAGFDLRAQTVRFLGGGDQRPDPEPALPPATPPDQTQQQPAAVAAANGRGR